MKFQKPSNHPSGGFLAAVILGFAAVATARADYQSTVLADNPLAYYPINFDVDPVGTTATDLSGNGNNGTYYGTDPEYNTVQGPSVYLTNALYFDGFTSFVDLSTGSNPSLLNFAGPVTMEAWVQPANTTEGPANILAKGYESSVNKEITLRANAGNYYGGSYDGGTHAASGGQQTTNWAHLVSTYDGTNWSLYVNGTLVQSNPDATGSLNFATPWRIGDGTGDYGSSRYFLGNICQVALYNHGLSSAQVKAHYNVGMYGTTNPPPGSSLRWSATANNGVWDTGASANWINLSNSLQVVFNANDQVLFDDTVGVPTNAVVTGTVSPNNITVNSSANNYLINGAGTLNVAAGLVKKGSSTLTLNAPAYINGPAVISGGTVVAGNYAFASVSSITVTNGSTLDFSGGPIAGNKPVTVAGAGVGGVGALINNSYEIYGNNVLSVALIGDTTFGGNSRWDLGSGSTITGPYKVTINRTSGVYGEWNSVNIAQNVGDIEIASGKLGINNMGSTFGNPAATMTVDSGAELDFWSGSGYGKNYHVLNNGTLQILTGFTAFDGNFTLEDGAKFNAFYGSGNQPLNGTFVLNGVAHFVLGDANFIFTNVLSGSGGFLWDAYNHQMVLQASNTYSGPTIIGGGDQIVSLTGNGSISHSSLIFFGGATPTDVAVDVSGRPDQTLTLASGQTLAGVGRVNGSLVVSVGATLSPAGTNTTLGITTGANATGTISATNAIALHGNTTLKLNGSGVNDQVQAGAGISYGGTLNLVNISGTPLANGNSFQVFSAASYAGSFAGITPATPGPGLAWDTSQLNTFGFINVATGSSQPVIGSTMVSGGHLIFSGTGGSAGGSYAVLTTTNLATPIGGWTAIMTNSFDGAGAFSVTNAISPGTPQLFYRIKQLP